MSDENRKGRVRVEGRRQEAGGSCPCWLQRQALAIGCAVGGAPSQFFFAGAKLDFEGQGGMLRKEQGLFLGLVNPLARLPLPVFSPPQGVDGWPKANLACRRCVGNTWLLFRVILEKLKQPLTHLDFPLGSSVPLASQDNRQTCHRLQVGGSAP